MENATKALIIAGSILIAITIIAVGVRIFKSGDETAHSVESALGGREVLNFNNKFIQYEGSGKSGKEVKELIKLVRVSNITNSEYSKIAFYVVNGGVTTWYHSENDAYANSDNNLSVFSSMISNDAKYKVKFYYYSESLQTYRHVKEVGLLHDIEIEEEV